MVLKRKKTRKVRVGSVYVGGDAPISVQSMAKTKSSDVEATVKQIKELEACGCEIVRLAIKDSADVAALGRIKKQSSIPVVADIHFDWRLALSAIEWGADKIRLNPGNIYKADQIKEIVRQAKQTKIPIRVGLNSGSLERVRSGLAYRQAGARKNKDIASLMTQAALDYIRIMERAGFCDIVVSLKASNIFDTIAAYRKFSGVSDYPLHLGVTASGLPQEGAVKSSIAMGNLLLDGIGDTIRVSLTDNPVEEVRVARSILESLGLRRFGCKIISCPTCGRCEVDMVKIVRELESKLASAENRLSLRPVKVAVMGCVVNGPGEAKEADLGIAFGRKEGLLFKKGKAIKKVSARKCVEVLLKEISSLTNR